MLSLKKLSIGILSALLIASSLQAQESTKSVTPFQYSIFSPIQLFGEEYDVYGCRLTLLYGVNASVCGVDAGLYSVSTGDQYGFQGMGVVSSREGDTTGVTCAGIANLSKGSESGVSLAGLFDFAMGDFSGLQAAGLICHARKFNGMQISLFNHCDDFEGVQFGLVNICKSQTLPFTLFINFRFK